MASGPHSLFSISWHASAHLPPDLGFTSIPRFDPLGRRVPACARRPRNCRTVAIFLGSDR